MNSNSNFFAQTHREAVVRTCLCFIRCGEEVLLIRKKRGIGAGKINGPGGHLEPGETALEAAVRETQEELRVTPLDLKMMGELSFQFVDESTGRDQQCDDGISGALHTVVFLAEGYEGEPVETAEATPHWIHQTKIPFHEMWEDDQYWLPGMLEGKMFKGFFHFDGDKMLSRCIEWGSFFDY